jgi:hypothetical protein
MSNSNPVYFKKGADSMQLTKAEREKNNARSGRFCKRIGPTLYEVNVYFDEAGRDSVEDKILRLVSNEALKGRPESAILKALQTERLPERGSA